MRRAFLIQLNPHTVEDPCNGLIEHVDSGRSKHFHSLNEAVSFVKRVLSETEQSEGEWSESDLIGEMSNPKY